MRIEDTVDEGWIKIELGCKMPKIGERVFVTLRTSPEKLCTVGIAAYGWVYEAKKIGWSPDGGQYQGRWDISQWVLAWRPLPEPYEPNYAKFSSMSMKSQR